MCLRYVQDRYDTNTEEDIVTTFETVPGEADAEYSIHEADAPSDVSSYGSGAFHSASTTSASGYAGTGFYAFKKISDLLEMTVTVPAAGTYPLSFRYSRSSTSWNRNGQMQLWVNDELIEAAYDFKNTGSGSYWMYSELLDVSLDAGNNAIKLVAHETNGANIDHLRIGKPPAVIMKSELVCNRLIVVLLLQSNQRLSFILVSTASGWPRTIAKHGIHLLDGWPFEFTNSTGASLSFSFSIYPDPKLGDLDRYQHGRIRIRLPDGKHRFLDIGNVSLCIAKIQPQTLKESCLNLFF